MKIISWSTAAGRSWCRSSIRRTVTSWQISGLPLFIWRAVDESRRNAELVIPRCFGLLSSTQTLEETGAARVRRQSQLELFGQGVMFGIVDTGDGV